MATEDAAGGSFSAERIHIHALEVYCIIGVLPRERIHKQPVRISVSWPAQTPFSQASAQDDLSHTTDYSAVAQQIRHFVENSAYHLLETLIQRLAITLCTQFALPAVQLEIRKPQAIPQSQGAAVSLTYHPPLNRA